MMERGEAPIAVRSSHALPLAPRLRKHDDQLIHFAAADAA
jgi:hypothetical protein